MSQPAAPPASASEPLNPPDPQRVERFRTDLTALVARATGLPPAPDIRFAVAVSGGADSMAMLLLANAAFPGRVIAATVDHGLRAEAADETALVASTCTTLGVPHRTLAPLVPVTGSSIQKQAREARYSAMAAWLEREGVDRLLTAHHADDQAETLLMRLNRASGTTGLSGIRPYRQSGACLILRPLLRWRRSELRDIAKQANLRWIEDPSNADVRHDRTRYRAFLAGQTLLSANALAASVAYIHEAEGALADLTDQIWHERWRAEASQLRAHALPREVRRRLLRRAVFAVRDLHGVTQPHFSDGSNVEGLLDALEAGNAATQAGLLVTPDHDGHWHFTPAPPRRSL